jgi:hypothetical protein
MASMMLGDSALESLTPSVNTPFYRVPIHIPNPTLRKLSLKKFRIWFTNKHELDFFSSLSLS